MKERIADFFFPRRCASCGETLPEGEKALCPECREVLEALFCPSFFRCGGGNGFADAAFSLFPYESGTVKRILFDFKKVAFEEDEATFCEFVRRAEKKMTFLSQIDLVTFAPRSRFRRAKFFLDQSEEMARAFSAQFSVPFEKLLERSVFSLPQHRMDPEKRRRNVKGSFRALRALEGESVLLIDDIVTTGATVREAARALKRAGAMHVFVLSFAH